MATVQKTKSAITLKGSAEIICDYLNCGINSILFQRGIYPPETFKSVENYELTMFMSQDKKIIEFLEKTLVQLKEWLVQRYVNKIALIITNVKTRETLERWDFKVEYEGDSSEQVSDKPLPTIKKEIRDVVRQITASVTYLPLLDCLCSFDVQIYTKDDIELPEEWTESEPANIKNAQSVRMKAFSTNLHKMETVVTYKNTEL
ncbi:mitotic spindle assembly checkpoint protein MAD2A [Coccinella septempunctata]|uniref:mitotic spindle assembly checkpoint protein MAD2A n=1 Tax=Coccinella septempunctata TaxID=41139 RepID=UPI001D0802CE|nr:mitotic spindle assembly checkpoint protein MAD2A [Coccinella septempunctata]